MSDRRVTEAVEAVSAYLLQETDIATTEFRSSVRKIKKELKIRSYVPGEPDEHWIAETNQGSALIFCNLRRKPLIDPACPPIAALALAMRFSGSMMLCPPISLTLRGRRYRIRDRLMEMYPDKRDSFVWASRNFRDLDGQVVELGKAEQERLLAETRFGPHDRLHECRLTVAGEEVLGMNLADRSSRIAIDSRDPHARHKLAFAHHLSELWAGSKIHVRFDNDTLILLNGEMIEDTGFFQEEHEHG